MRTFLRTSKKCCRWLWKICFICPCFWIQSHLLLQCHYLVLVSAHDDLEVCASGAEVWLAQAWCPSCGFRLQVLYCACHTTVSRAVWTQGLGVARNASHLKDASHQQAIRSWCLAIEARDSLGAAVAHRDVWGILHRITFTSDFWAISGICPLFSSLIVIGIQLTRSGRMVTLGLGVDPVCRVFLDPQRWHPDNANGRRPTSLRAAGQTEVADSCSYNFTTVILTPIGGL